jgi:DNA-binding transcriptional LysR family regulator
MQTELLETFLDLCATRSFHRSADRLGVTQSTVSARLRALEAAVGARLMERGRAGARLTTEGLRFEPEARALLRDWQGALRAVRGAGERAMAVRLGIQHDLAGGFLGDWLAAFRASLPDTALYIEPDYSTQMCADIAAGTLDFAVLFTPQPHPDLHFASLGELRYRMVAVRPMALRDVAADRYILGNYAPAFTQAHRAALPRLSDAPVASGQNAAVAALFGVAGEAAYLAEDTAAAMIAAGAAHAVDEAPVLTQPVQAAMLVRLRTARLQARLLAIARRVFAARHGPAAPGVTTEGRTPARRSGG